MEADFAQDRAQAKMSLSRRSVETFKRAAKARRVPYRRMIRALVDAYAERQER
jgi:predicted DNA binding CopG/RHH family protein